MNRFLTLLPIFLCMMVFQTTAQQTANSQLPSEFSRSKVIIPFFEKENTIGSPYLSGDWMQGVVELTSHQILPLPGEPLLFNFDKMHNYLYFVNGGGKISFYKIDSVSGFRLTDGSVSYEFEKVSWISNDFFLTGMIKSENGYSLYKRIFTRLVAANYSNEGYFSTGNKFDEYLNERVYYITFPGNKTFKKFYPGMKDVRKVLRSEARLVKDFFSLHDENDIDEQGLIGLVQFLNDKKYPD